MKKLDFLSNFSEGSRYDMSMSFIKSIKKEEGAKEAIEMAEKVRKFVLKKAKHSQEYLIIVSIICINYDVLLIILVKEIRRNSIKS